MRIVSNKPKCLYGAIGNPEHAVRTRAAMAGVAMALGMLAAPPVSAAEMRSTYTSLAINDCKQDSADVESASATFSCPGLDGIAVTLGEGDLRMFIGYGDEPRQSCVFRQTFGPFNTVGGKLEWRLKDGLPIATIVRYRLDDGFGKTFSFLAVAALTPNDACHMAYVDGALPDHNAIARLLADTQAETFQCDRDSPLFLTKAAFKLEQLVSGAPCSGDAAMKFQE